MNRLDLISIMGHDEWIVEESEPIILIVSIVEK
jgi:hypothetical protein